VKQCVAIERLPADRRDSVLLTFDDGPHPEGTPAVLDVLERYGARAVFFIVGSRVARAPEMLRRIAAAGHVLGNHSHAHPLGRQFGLRACRRDIDACQQIVHELAGRRPRLFRPPLGHLSAASVIAPRLSGLIPMLWSVDSHDWTLRTAEAVAPAAERLLQALSVRPLRHIVLCHDETRLTAELLDRVLPKLVARDVNLRPTIGGDWYLPESVRQ
jgi:peptidoglycan/xylan/chitin deacetylase (PgdA/CDA1 family)